MQSIQLQLLSKIEKFEPSPSGDWKDLDNLLDELWQTQLSESCLSVLFRVFERYYNDDGAGVFWSIVHGVEATALDYENALRKSIANQQSEMGEIMLRRLEKTKTTAG